MVVKDLLVLMAPDAGGGEGTLLTGAQPEGEGNQGQQNNDGNQTNNPAGEGSVNTPGWLGGVAKEYHDALKGFQKPTDFVKEALTWKDQLSNSIVKPPEGATAEQVAAYRQAMGIPENEDGYELPQSEMMNEEFVKQQKEFYLKNNFTAEQAKAVHEALIGQMVKGVDALQKANLEARQEAERTLKTELGDKYNQTLTDAKNALRRFASEEDVAYLTKTGLGNDAGIIKMFANIQKQIGGDSLLNPQGNTGTDAGVKEMFPNSPEMW